MKKFLAGAAKYIIIFGIAGLLIWWSLHGLTASDKEDIKSAFLRANYIVVLPVIVLLLFSNWIRSLRWQQIIIPLGYSPPVIDLLCGLLIGYMANQVVPRAGEIVRCTVIAGKDKIPVEKLIGTIIIERSFDVISLLLITLAVFYLEYEYIHEFIEKIFTAFKTGLQQSMQAGQWIIPLLIIVAIVVLVYFIGKRSKKWNHFFSKVIKGVWEGFISIKKVKNKPLFLLYTILIWLGYSFAIWIGCKAMHDTAHLHFSAALAILAAGSFGIILTPGGLGAYPVAIQKTLYFYHINKNVAIAFGWMLWLVQFLFTMVFGIIAWITLNERNKRHAKRISHST